MPSAIYWDASAILSLLFEDQHTSRAQRVQTEGIPQLVSSLAFAEVCAVTARLERVDRLSAQDRARVIRSLGSRPWSSLQLEPDRRRVGELAGHHPLRGADLWHLATAVTLAAELPQLAVATFDARLIEAARGEGLMIEPADGET